MSAYIPMSDFWKQFRNKDEIRQDAQQARHDPDGCDDDGVLAYMDAENPDDERACKYCGSVRFERNGDVEICAECGR